MCSLNKPVLIIAGSGRMLAQSAVKSGCLPLVIDLFADRDTCKWAVEVRAVKKLVPSELAPHIEYYVRQFKVRDVVYGSGLELYPESLDFLEQKFNFVGNSATVFHELLDKVNLFRYLDNSGINYPESSFSKPSGLEKWLAKSKRSHGGIGIYQGNRLIVESSAVNQYWQRYIPGQPMSVLFLADGQHSRIVGFNQQWQVNNSFVFSGVAGPVDFPVEQKQRVQNWISTLVSGFALKGLNGLDFIWDGQDCWFLEINARPSASMVLYEENFPNGLLNEHIKACRGESFNTGIETRGSRAYQVIYAKIDCRVSCRFKWPEWALDIPGPDTLIRVGQPVCSIIASGDSWPQMKEKLQARRNIIIHQLKR